MSGDFNAAAARAKRPLPLWVDALMADTHILGADEFGAYLRILCAMWRRESCDLPNDERRLAMVASVSTRLWRSRIGPALMEFLTVEGDVVTQKRLRKEAAAVEEFLAKQSARRRPVAEAKPESGAYAEPAVTSERHRENAEKSRKPLKSRDASASADHPRNHPRHHPTYNLQPISNDADEELGAREPSLFDRVLEAAGLNGSDILPTRWMPPAAEIEVNRWRDLGLSDDQIVATVRESRARHSEPPAGPRAFEREMRRLSSVLSAPSLKPVPQPATGDQHGGSFTRSRSDVEFLGRLERIARRAAG